MLSYRTCFSVFDLSEVKPRQFILQQTQDSVFLLNFKLVTPGDTLWSTLDIDQLDHD